MWLDNTGIASTVAGHAAPWRLSGYLPLPSYGGLIPLVFLFIIYLLVKSGEKFTPYLLILCLVNIYLGFRSYSTIFHVGFFLILFIFVFERLRFLIFPIFIIGTSFFVFNFDFLIDRLFGGRLKDGSDLYLMLEMLDLNIFFSGLFDVNVSDFVSDNMVLIRVFTYGFFITLSFYLMSFFVFFNDKSSSMLYLFLLFLFSELGVRVFSAPGLVTVILIFIFHSSYFFKRIN